MEITKLLEEKINELHTPWVKDGVQTYFSEPSELAKLVEPLVIALRWDGNYREIVEALPHSAKDLTLTEFINVMAEIGYKSEKIEGSLHKIKDSLLPCLFIPSDGEAIVVLENYDDGLEIIDGCDGKQKNIEKQKTSGVIYHFSIFDIEKDEAIKKQESFKVNFLRFRPLIIQVVVLTMIQNFFMAMVPIYIMMIYDRVIPSESVGMLISFMIGILIFMTSAQILAVARIKIIAYIGARLDKTLGESIIRHLLYLPPSYTENNTVGNQISRIKSFDSIRDFFTSPIAIMVCELPFTIIFLGVIIWLGGWLGLVPVFLAAVFYALYHIANPVVTKYTKLQAQQNTIKQTFLLESFARIRDIKETGRINVWEDKFSEMLTNVSRHSMDHTFYSSGLSIISETMMMLAALAMLSLGAFTAMYAELSLGMLIAIMMLTWKILNPLKAFFSALPKIEQIQSSIGQVNKLFTIPVEKGNEKAIVPDEVAKSKIEFNRVTFKYRPDLAPALLGVSVIIKPGELVCVTGKNSSGKSTLLRMILGMYKPQAGSISINDMNIAQFDPIQLRHMISYLPQNIQLFYGTIKQNIMFGDIVATEAEMITAARLADVHEKIMSMPDQYDTRMGDHMSSKFSASFLQKITLARTYLKRSPIMLFDEPANSFDRQTEEIFLQVIDYLRSQSTIVWVTHRPSHLKLADKILYMEEGQVALFGEAEKVLERLPRSLM